MTTADDVARIHRLKYTYLRALDTKDWVTFASVLTVDARGDYGDNLRFAGRDEIVEYMRTSLGPGVITEHRVTHPEIDVDGDEATGRWYLQDRVIVPGFSFMLFGAAFYSDTYRRTDAGWLISSTGYDRTYEASISLDDLPSFALTTGAALNL